MQGSLYPLRSIHRIFVDYGLYLLALLFSIDIALVLIRSRVGHMQNYLFIPWNLFLACVPYAVSLCAAIVHRAFPRSWWLLLPLFPVWLLFLPNAPYLISDFVHLGSSSDLQVWYDSAMLATYAVTGCTLAILSLDTMHRITRSFLGWRVGWLFVVVTLFLTGIGVHLGRVQRYNSWDILLNTEELVAEVIDRTIHLYDHPHTTYDALYYGLLLMMSYVSFLAIRDKTTRAIILRGEID